MASNLNDDFVRLNVGGVIFLTTRSTLINRGSTEPSSYFTALFEGKIPVSKDDSGAILIDRSPEKFRVILEFLRTGYLEIPKDINTRALEFEADYYCLDFIKTAIKEIEPDTSNSLQSFKDGCYCLNDLAYAFLDDTRVVVSTSGPHLIQAFLMAYPVSELWLKGRNDAEVVVANVTSKGISRGTYELSDNQLIIRTSLTHVDLGLITSRDTLLLITPQKVDALKFQRW